MLVVWKVFGSVNEQEVSKYETHINERKVQAISIASEARSSNDAVCLTPRAALRFLVGRKIGGCMRDDAVSLTAWSAFALLVGGCGGGERDGAEGVHWRCSGFG